MIKSCCVIGHSNLLSNQIDHAKMELREQIRLAIQAGYTHFISGFVSGSDFYFERIYAELKKKYPNITLEAAIPYRGRLETKDEDFQKQIKLCDKITVLAEDFHKDCYYIRNMYMVNQSERVIAVYDGRDVGGTAFTILYAQIVKRELNIIKI